MIAAQVAMVGTAALCGARADAWGRRTFFLAACVALAVRGVLYTLSDAPAWAVTVQLLDGGRGLWGTVSGGRVRPDARRRTLQCRLARPIRRVAVAGPSAG